MNEGWSEDLSWFSLQGELIDGLLILAIKFNKGLPQLPDREEVVLLLLRGGERSEGRSREARSREGVGGVLNWDQR